jgi:hypothetical protein
MVGNPGTPKRKKAKSKAVARPADAKRSAAKFKTKGPLAPAATSDAESKNTKQAVEQQIDDFMKQVGYANPSERTDENGWRWFEYKSARGRAGVVESASDGQTYLRAESLVMQVPADPNVQLSLMNELLETNMTIPGPARLGIGENMVFVCATTPLAKLGADDVPDNIHSVMEIAASFNNPPPGEVTLEEAGQAPAPPVPSADTTPQAE